MSNFPEDNLEAAMNEVADSIVPTRAKNTGASKGETAQSQILIRASTDDHELIKKAAAFLGISMSEFVRNTAVEKARELTECQHPMSHRKAYPWSEFCLKCGQRLRDGDGLTYNTQKAKK
jgi:hypothetical protein